MWSAVRQVSGHHRPQACPLPRYCHFPCAFSLVIRFTVDLTWRLRWVDWLGSLWSSTKHDLVDYSSSSSRHRWWRYIFSTHTPLQYPFKTVGVIGLIQIIQIVIGDIVTLEQWAHPFNLRRPSSSNEWADEVNTERISDQCGVLHRTFKRYSRRWFRSHLDKNSWAARWRRESWYLQVKIHIKTTYLTGSYGPCFVEMVRPWWHYVFLLKMTIYLP